ncbi:MAG: class I SAM-dependent methyltransferase [Candidatus Saccharimonadales bacterium]
MKLHLGCGQVYLEGYVNIDYPLSKHTVQQKSVADEFADLTDMKYKPESIEEVRLHHVFEHFPRTQAVALLVSWHSWLKKGGRVHIEVPEFDATARLVLDPKVPKKDRRLAMRHIFGSNEAPWAVHYDGWNEERFKELFDTFGFKTEKVERNSYMATRNIEVFAKKNKKTPSSDKIREKARDYLRPFTVNDSEFETRLLEIWLNDFTGQLKKTFVDL